MTSAALIGGGSLGGAVAHALATRDAVDRVIIVDAQASVAAGKALDIQQAGAIAGVHTRLEGSGDLSRIAGCDVCVIADRANPADGEWQGEAGLAHIAAVLRYAGDSPLVFAGTLQADLMRHLSREGRVASHRLIGSSPEGLRSAVRAIVAVEARCAPAEVMVSVLGAPPGFVVPWSEASIGGHALEAVLSAAQLQRVEARTQRLWPLGTHALGAAAAVVANAVLRSSRRAYSILTPLDGEFGVRGRIGAISALLSSTGIVFRRTPTLSSRERVRVESALDGAFA